MKIKFKYILTIIVVIGLTIVSINYPNALHKKSFLSYLDITTDETNNLTINNYQEIDDFLKNPYKGYSSEDAYNQTTGGNDWKDSVDIYATEGYLRLNWYLFYKDSFVGPTDATNYKDEAYNWSVLFNLIKLYADHNMKLRFGVMTANTTSTDEAINAYINNFGKISDWSNNTLKDLKMPKGSIIPIADYIPVITLENNRVKLTCGSIDCSKFDNNSYDNYTHTKYTVKEDDVIYKARNITPMWMFKGIPSGYNKNGEPIYSEDAVNWYLDIKNVHWIPKWDDPNLHKNINNFVTAMSNYLKNEEYNGKKLIDYISNIEVRSYGNYGENHINETSLNSVNDDFRNPLQCGFLDTSAHIYQYALELDSNFIYPKDCYFELNGEKIKILDNLNWHFSYTDTVKYYTNISFEYYYEKYLKTYIKAFEDTNIRITFNWFATWDSEYYYDKGYVSDGTIKKLLEKYRDYLTIRVDSIFGSNFGEGYQLAQANGISPTAFEYAFARYQALYDNEDYFPSLKDKIKENNLCTNRYNCVTEYFINAVENSRVTYMDYNYVLYDYYQNYLNKVENDYTLDLDYLGNSIGYHFIMKQATYNSKVNLSEKDESNLSIDLKIVNDGVTYLYDKKDTKVYLALLETDGNGNVILDKNNKTKVFKKYLTNINPTTWKSTMDITGNRNSNDSNNWILEHINLNIKDIETGKYILALGIFTDFDSNYPTIKLGNNGGTNDNWYVLGEAEFNYEQYNINYNSNGGTGEMTSIIVNKGESIKLSKNIFIRDGYTFIGWNTKPNGTGKSYIDEEIVIDLVQEKESITLYAQWKINTYTVRFNSNDGIGEMTSITVNTGESIKLPKNIFTKEGYTFIGWNTKPDGTGYSYSDEQTINIIENITLYAIWDKNKIIINNSTDYEGIYDGKEHSINIDVNISNYDIKYSIDSINYNLNDLPKYKNIGEYTIYYKISSSGYEELFGSNQVKIYGIKQFNNQIIKKDNYLILESNNFNTLIDNIDIYSKSTSFTHLDHQKRIIHNEFIKTGDFLNIKLNDNRIYQFELAYLGDVNGNGEIDIIDYIRIMKEIMGTSKLTGIYYEAANINRNDTIDIIDYIRIMKIIMAE